MANLIKKFKLKPNLIIVEPEVEPEPCDIDHWKGLEISFPKIYIMLPFELGIWRKLTFEDRVPNQLGHIEKYLISPHSYGIRGSSIYRWKSFIISYWTM